MHPSLTLALAVALGLVSVLEQLPRTEAARFHGKGEDETTGADDDDDDDDDDDSDGSNTPEVAAAASAAWKGAYEAAMKKAPPTPPAAPPKALRLVKTRSNASHARDVDDGDDDSDDDKEDDAADATEDDPAVQQLRGQEKAEKAQLANVSAELDVVAMKKTQTKAKLSDLTDPAADAASAKEITVAVKAIANETGSETLGTTLGKMWSEMRMYGGPFYQEHLTRDLQKLDSREAKLEATEKNIKAKLEGTRSKLDKALDAEHADAQVADEKPEVKNTDEPEVQAAEEESESAAGTSDADAAEKVKPKRDRETANTYLAIWAGALVVGVAVVYFIARQRM